MSEHPRVGKLDQIKTEGQKPAIVRLADGGPIYCEYVDPHDGYLLIRTAESDMPRYLPWHRVREVERVAADHERTGGR